MRSAATTPAAGPERRMSAGWAAASSSVATPPDERITSGAGSPASAADAPSAREVAAGDRAKIGVGGGRRRPLVLAELGRDLVRRDHVRLRVPSAQLLGDSPFVRRVAEREEQADGDRLRFDLGQAREVERRDARRPARFARPRRRSAPAEPAARDGRRRVDRGGRDSAVAGGGGARSPRSPQRPSARPSARAVRWSPPSSRARSARPQSSAASRMIRAASTTDPPAPPRRHLRRVQRPLASSTASVKVPPTSTPRNAIAGIQHRRTGRRPTRSRLRARALDRPRPSARARACRCAPSETPSASSSCCRAKGRTRPACRPRLRDEPRSGYRGCCASRVQREARGAEGSPHHA